MEYTWYEIYFGLVLFGGLLVVGGAFAQVLGSIIFAFTVELPFLIVYGLVKGVQYLNNRMRTKDIHDGTI